MTEPAEELKAKWYNNMKRHRIALLFQFLLLSCLGSPRIRVGPETLITLTPTDDRPGIGSEHVQREAMYFADRIEIRIRQVPGYNVGNLKVTVFQEDLYLSPLYISSGGDAIQTFRLEYPTGFSYQKPPGTIYWITAAIYPWPWQWEAGQIQAYPLPIVAH